jgi:adenine phosphoribosyltransferase
MAIAQDEFLAERVRNATRNAIGFPNPFNKQFRDISPVVEGDPALFRAVVQVMADLCKETAPDCIMCVESWGYIFGAPVAYLLGRPDVFGAPTWEAPTRSIR